MPVRVGFFPREGGLLSPCSWTCGCEIYKEQVKENRQVDVVLSHTCPYKYEPVEAFLPMINQDTVDDSTEHWLDEIEEQLAYDAWMCGHWHINKRIDKLHFLFHDFEAASQLNLSITQEDGGQYDGI